MDKLDKEQIEELRICFDEFDKDNSGTIDQKELLFALTSLGQKVDMEQVNEMMKEADENGDNEITFEEFVNMIAPRMIGEKDEVMIKKTFELFDQDGDGYITGSELNFLMKSIGVRMTEEEIKIMIAALDKDSDGKVSYEEFREMVLE